MVPNLEIEYMTIHLINLYMNFRRHCEKRKKLSKRRLLVLKKLLDENTKLNKKTVHRSCWIRPELKLATHGKYWEHTVPILSDDRFFEKFRMSRDDFKFLCESLHPHLHKQDTKMRKAIQVDKRVAISLYILKGTTDFGIISDLFGVGQSTVPKILTEFCDAVQLEFSDLVKFPHSEEERTALSAKFLERWQFPGVFGAIDGTHIPIIPPLGKRQDYYNYKCFYSINVLAVCNHEYKFIYYVVGAPGKCNDASIFRRSKLFDLFHEKNVTKYHIIGDGAFPLLNFLMKPYPQSIDMPVNQQNFNYRLSRARMVIEDSFGRLKARWRILLRRPDIHYETALNVIKTCFLLHNYCEDRRSLVQDEWIINARREEEEYQNYCFENLRQGNEPNCDLYIDDSEDVSPKLKRILITKNVFEDGYSIKN